MRHSSSSSSFSFLLSISQPRKPSTYSPTQLHTGRSSSAGAVELLEGRAAGRKLPTYFDLAWLELFFWVGHHEITGMVDTSIAGMEDASIASFVCMFRSEECLD
ncbi:hypothetical protein L3X38_037668 [Prunus dulcis]|uniref:Uncharacterized protein n=1 Tax=Prunus dulcis TaxID=3755 RepID=A0AAD4YQN0_PRUDU|nr:hypothetical protein L3X38_037668 [Prunus dulcis]